MLVKRAKATDIYQINLYCDKCGKRFGRGFPTYIRTDLSSVIDYEYKCSCGHSVRSRACFPLQQVQFDEKHSRIVSEEEFNDMLKEMGYGS